MPADELNEIYGLYATAKYDNVKRATILLENGVRQYPDDAKVLSLLAQVYCHLTFRDWHFGQKDTAYIEEAEALVVKAMRLAPNDAVSLRAHGMVLLTMGRREEAARDLKKATEVSPGDAESWYLWACASDGSLINGDTDAGTRMDKALQLAPNLAWARQDMTMSYLKAGNMGLARQSLSAMAQSQQDYPSFSFYEGMVLLHEGKTEEARAKFQNFVDKAESSNLTEYVKLYLNR